MCLRVPAAPPRSTRRRSSRSPQQATCTDGLRRARQGRGRGGAGQAAGKGSVESVSHQRVDGQSSRGERVAPTRPIEEVPMRKVTSSPGGAGAGASLHRGGAAARGAPAPKAPSSAGTAQRRYACAGDLRESSRAAEEEGKDGPHTVAPCRGAAPPSRPHRPPRLERAPAGQAPGELPAAVGRRGELILRVGGPRRGAGCSGLSRAPEGRPRMPEPRPDPVLGHSLVEALRGLPEAPPGSFQAARTPV